MKNFLLILALLLTENLVAQKVKTENLILVTEKTIHYTNNGLRIKVRLWNNSNDTLNYLSMSCSWQEFFKTNKKNIIIKINNCDKNIPQILKLEPGQSRLVELHVVKSNGIMDDFKIGMAIIQTKELKMSSANYTSKEGQIIWSSSIYL